MVPGRMKHAAALRWMQEEDPAPGAAGPEQQVYPKLQRAELDSETEAVAWPVAEREQIRELACARETIREPERLLAYW